jgi:hypothetical protein
VTAEDNKDIAELQQVNANLTESLDRCRRIVKDCESLLAASCGEIKSDRRGHRTR